MSGRMSKCMKGESTGRLSEDELCHAAGLLHRAVVFEQNRFIVEKIARQLHGKEMAVHAGAVLEQISGMVDSSKRRFDESDVESSHWDHLSSVSETEFQVPKPDAGCSAGSHKGDARSAADAVFAVASIELPKGISSAHEWGRTVIQMKKYASSEITYAQLVSKTKSDKDAERYVGWLQSTYTPKDIDMQVADGVTQAVDFARYLKMIGWKKGGTEEFVRRLK